MPPWDINPALILIIAGLVGTPLVCIGCYLREQWRTREQYRAGRGRPVGSVHPMPTRAGSARHRKGVGA